MESDAAELRRQVDSLKDEVDSEHKKQSTFEHRIIELNEKLRNAENTASTTSDRLVQESSSLEFLNKTKVQNCAITFFSAVVNSCVILEYLRIVKLVIFVAIFFLFFFLSFLTK